MKTNTAYRKQEVLIQALKDVYSSARVSHRESFDINADITAVFETAAKCPRWLRSYLRGYARALYEAHWNQVEFCYNIEGIWYTTSHRSVRDRYPDEWLHKLGDCYSAFLYLKKDATDPDKLYTAPSKANN